MATRVRLDSKGMLAALNQKGVRKAVTAAANRAAARLDGQVIAHDGPVDVVVDEYQSDRPVAGITLAHPGGIGLQAEYGYLTEAVTAVGLEIGRVDEGSKLVDYVTRSGKKRKATQRQVDNWTRGRK